MNVESLLEEWRAQALEAPVAREVFEADGRLLNFHGRVVRRPPEEVWTRLARLGSALDDAWPLPSVAMKNEGPLAPGVRSGHGAGRYECIAVEEGVRIEWRLTMHVLRGRHEYAMRPAASGTYVEHVIDGTVPADDREVWSRGAGPFHDWISERLFERLEQPPVPWIPPALRERVR
jgi:hypothetical protein